MSIFASRVACAALVMFMLVCADELIANEDVTELEWDALMPQNWDPFAKLNQLMESSGGTLEDGSPEAEQAMREYLAAGKSAPVVPELNGKRVRIPGFAVPLDFDGAEVFEFLLVPYFGACIHVPPPPANQIVYVKSQKSYSTEQIHEPVWVTGRLSTEAFYNDVGDAGYTLQATDIEPYQE